MKQIAAGTFVSSVVIFYRHRDFLIKLSDKSKRILYCMYAPQTCYSTRAKSIGNRSVITLESYIHSTISVDIITVLSPIEYHDIRATCGCEVSVNL